MVATAATPATAAPVVSVTRRLRRPAGDLAGLTTPGSTERTDKRDIPGTLGQIAAAPPGNLPREEPWMRTVMAWSRHALRKVIAR